MDSRLQHEAYIQTPYRGVVKSDMEGQPCKFHVHPARIGESRIFFIVTLQISTSINFLNSHVIFKPIAFGVSQKAKASHGESFTKGKGAQNVSQLGGYCTYEHAKRNAEVGVLVSWNVAIEYVDKPYGCFEDEGSSDYKDLVDGLSVVWAVMDNCKGVSNGGGNSFELLILSTTLAELSWPAILNKRNAFREVFLDFNQTAVSKLNEKKILTPVSILISEVKLQATIENARQTSKLGALSFIVV
ncbi:hypothetical protein C3L33_15706, partial [Rhododendron williamsianum]